MHALRGHRDQIVYDGDSRAQEDEDPPSPSYRRWFSRSKDKDAERMEAFDLSRRGSISVSQHYNPDRNLIRDEISKSSKESNLTVIVEQVSIFLTRDGTVISFFQVFPPTSLLTT